MSGSGHREYQPHVDGLRAIAVLAVALFHFGLPGVPGGFLGVDVFFVISGYLIVRLIRDEVLETGRFRFGRFFLRRVRRLFPALFTTLALSSLCAVLLLSPEHLRGFGRELAAAVLSVSNILFRYERSQYFSGAVEFKPLLHTWSLSVEEQFYLVAPFLIVLLMRVRGGLLGLMVVLTGLTLVLAEIERNRMSAFYITPFRIFEFGLGALLLWVPPRFVRPGWAAEAGVLAGLALLAASFHFLDAASRMPGLLTLVPVAGAMLLILMGGQARLGRLLANPASVGIGQISYSLYLLHWPVFVFASYTTPTPLSGPVLAVLFGLTLAGSWLMWRFVEQPFRRVKPVGGNRRFLFGAGGAAGLAVLLSTAIVWGQGWPWRLPPEGVRLLASTRSVAGVSGPCRYETATIDPGFQKRFDACFASSGKAVLVIGDSHGQDLFGALASNATRTNVVGINKPGCRPIRAIVRDCFYKQLKPFIDRNADRIAALVYTEKGGNVLVGFKDLPVNVALLKRTADYLESIDPPGIPMVWVGPQAEPFYEVDKYPVLFGLPENGNYFRDERRNIQAVDEAIRTILVQRDSSISYVSKLAVLGPLTAGNFVVDGEYTYTDTDHWSGRGEEVFGRRLIEGSPVLKELLDPPRGEARP